MSDNRILFVCLGNTCRSQMAEGFARHYSAGRAEVKSAGMAPYVELVGPTIDVMMERGIDISCQEPKELTRKLVDWADVVVSLCHHRTASFCPTDFRGRRFDWDIFDPFGDSMATYREVRNEIERRVKGLFEELNIDVSEK